MESNNKDEQKGEFSVGDGSGPSAQVTGAEMWRPGLRSRAPDAVFAEEGHELLHRAYHNVPLLTLPSLASPAPVFNFSPALINYYCGSVGFTPPHPGLQQLSGGPGFLTAAGYHYGQSVAPMFGGVWLPGPSQLPVGQSGTPLHVAALIGDKHKLAEIIQDKSVNLETRDRWGRVGLTYAVLGNHQECVELLLRAGAKPEAVDCHNRNTLHYASYKGYLGCIKAILHAVESRGLVPGEGSPGVWLAQDLKGVTALHHLAIQANHKCLQLLLKYATPGTLDTEDHRKRTPLHWAAAYGCEENVRLLIKHGANNLLPDQEGKTPLHWAAMSMARGARDCVRTLISAAPSSVNWQDFEGITALHLAVAEARKDVVAEIVSVQRCNVDLTDNQFRTALHWTCSRGLTSTVAHLLKRGAHLGAVDVYGATPLHYAAQLNHADTVELLVKRPCVRDDPSRDGHTALLWAAARGADSALTVMVRHGAALSQADPRGCTALHIAAGAGHVSTVGVLLRLRAPPDVCAHDGRTPLLHAAQAGHAQIVKILAKAGASLDHRDNEGQCALHHAVLSGRLYLAQILIKAGTSVNVQDYSGRTPLHMAAYRGLGDIMFLLLENRGDINARDHEGQSPLHWAAEQGHLGAVNTLLDFHAYPNYTRTTEDQYTALDCAYVAEHLEVAQVVMEAGGLSVTRIMDLAATRLQAFIRCFLARRRYTRLQQSSSECCGGSLEMKCAVVESVSEDSGHTKKNVSQASQQEQPARATPDHCAGNNFLCHPSQEEADLATADTHEMGVEETGTGPASASAALHSPLTLGQTPSYAVVYGKRRAKTLASSITRGARKKTLRNLELPEPSELGIGLCKPTGTAVHKDSDGEEKQQAEGTEVVAEALHHTASIAGAVVAVQVDRLPPHTSHSDDESLSHNQRTDNLSDISNKHHSECYINDEWNTVNVHLVKKSNEQQQDRHKGNNKCHSAATVTEQSLLELKENLNNSDSKQTKNRKLFVHRHRTVIATEDRRSALEEKAAASLNLAEQMSGTSLRLSQAHSGGGPRTLSADYLKRAEERWNNKLASLTLQAVQRPKSAKLGVPYSYNLNTAEPCVPKESAQQQ